MEGQCLSRNITMLHSLIIYLRRTGSSHSVVYSRKGFRPQLTIHLVPVFANNNGKLTEVTEAPFNLEKEMQQITENNLDSIFKLEFVRSEFELNGLRIDTLAFDKETSSFVIIEYKKDRNLSIVDQGMAYLSLLLNNKAEFILEYNEHKNKGMKKKDADFINNQGFQSMLCNKQLPVVNCA